MTNAPSPDLFAHDGTLKPGEVALVLRPDGGVQIAHNVASVRETGLIKGGPTGAGFLMALALVELMGTQTYMAAMVEASKKLDGLSFSGATGTVN